MVRLGLSEIQGTSCLGAQLSETSCQGMNCQRVSWRSVKKSTESRTCHRRKPDLRVGHNFEIVFFRQVAFLHLGRKNSSRSKVSIEIRKEFASELFSEGVEKPSSWWKKLKKPAFGFFPLSQDFRFYRFGITDRINWWEISQRPKYSGGAVIRCIRFFLVKEKMQYQSWWIVFRTLLRTSEYDLQLDPDHTVPIRTHKWAATSFLLRCDFWEKSCFENKKKTNKTTILESPSTKLHFAG